MRIDPVTIAPREPITLDSLKDHLRIDEATEDAYLASLIETARQTLEVAYNIAFITRDVHVYLDGWPHDSAERWWSGQQGGALGDMVSPRLRIAIPVRPAQTLVMVEVFRDEVWQAVPQDGSYLQPGLGPMLYPSAALRSAKSDRATDGIRLRLAVGFGADWNAVPAAIQMAVLRLSAHLYAHRGDAPVAAMTASGARQLMAPYRQVTL